MNAARHVSENLGIDYEALKGLMTGDNPKSLGQAIQRLRPTVNAGAEVERAETQATADANGTSITSTTATTSAARSKKQKP